MKGFLFSCTLAISFSAMSRVFVEIERKLSFSCFVVRAAQLLEQSVCSAHLHAHGITVCPRLGLAACSYPAHWAILLMKTLSALSLQSFVWCVASACSITVFCDLCPVFFMSLHVLCLSVMDVVEVVESLSLASFPTCTRIFEQPHCSETYVSWMTRKQPESENRPSLMLFVQSLLWSCFKCIVKFCTPNAVIKDCGPSETSTYSWGLEFGFFIRNSSEPFLSQGSSELGVCFFYLFAENRKWRVLQNYTEIQEL